MADRPSQRPSGPVFQGNHPGLRTNGKAFRLSVILFTISAILLIASIPLPYWHLRLLAPQYPDGLNVWAYINRLTGDVQEIDILNHYIGMRSLQEAARFERTLSIPGVIVLAFLVIITPFIRARWARFLALPALLFPVIFVSDLYFWLTYYGTNLDPYAPLSGAIKPFVPRMLGENRVGQFSTIASFDTGFYLATAASVLILAGLYFLRKAAQPTSST